MAFGRRRSERKEIRVWNAHNYGEVLMVHQIFRGEDFPHGLRCAVCKREMVEGEAINECFQRFIDDAAVVVLTCMGCQGKDIPDD